MSGVFCFRELEEWSCFSKKAVFSGRLFFESDCLMVALDLRAVFGGNVSSYSHQKFDAEKSLVFLEFSNSLFCWLR